MIRICIHGFENLIHFGFEAVIVMEIDHQPVS
jgi:hypothetical protein